MTEKFSMKDAIELLESDLKFYDNIPASNDLEKGYLAGVENSIRLLKRFQKENKDFDGHTPAKEKEGK